jgi:hypothetical protein
LAGTSMTSGVPSGRALSWPTTRAQSIPSGFMEAATRRREGFFVLVRPAASADRAGFYTNAVRPL